jgi:hypothetical protein
MSGGSAESSEFSLPTMSEIQATIETAKRDAIQELELLGVMVDGTSQYQFSPNFSSSNLDSSFVDEYEDQVATCAESENQEKPLDAHDVNVLESLTGFNLKDFSNQASSTLNDPKYH